MDKRLYSFRNLTTLEDRTFEAYDFIGALYQVNEAWFGGFDKVNNYVCDNSSRVTLLSNSPQSNVIGRVYFHD